MAKTKVDLCSYVWNVTTECTPVSSGCANFHAHWMATRLAGRYGYPKGNPFAVALHLRMNEPSHWKKPRAVFVC